MSQIADNLKTIQTAIQKTAVEYQCDIADLSLIAVSKKQPEERIEEALSTGHRIYGENRVQEGTERWAKRKKQFPDLELHLIGTLQTNKVKDAVKLFNYIHTVDRPKLAKALAKEMTAQNKFLPCFIQVNTGAEEQKSGVSPDQLPALLTVCREEGLNIIGLMCIPPADDPAGVHFAFLKKMAAEHNLEKLSMGMSGDYQKAIPLGATHIRVGTSFFGARPTNT